jgi:glycosyltransferase involved in cell wall biosynthesis
MWFLSAALRERFLETAGVDPDRVRSHVGPMPIEMPQELAEPRRELRRRLGMEGFTLLFLGRLVPVKGLAELLHAIAAFPKPVSIRIAGDGPERDALHELAHRLGIDAIFEGWVAGERKEALLRACDAIVVPSRPLDGLPTVLFEAQARALPIIATDAAAIPARMRSHPQVELVPPNDPIALRQAILRVHDRSAAEPWLRA